MAFALAISLDPATLGNPKEINLGVRSLSWKFIQRTLLVATRGGSADPRVSESFERRKATSLTDAFPYLHRNKYRTKTIQISTWYQPNIRSSSRSS
jgi:hypothetical protein